MDTTEALKAASARTAEVTARIDANIGDKLLKRARRIGMDECGTVKQNAAWERAARRTKRLELGRHEGHSAEEGHRQDCPPPRPSVFAHFLGKPL
jgi:hypothetical protein